MLHMVVMQEKGMGGAASLAADKVVATVGSVKALPPYLETEIKSLMLKVTLQILRASMLLAPLVCACISTSCIST